MLASVTNFFKSRFGLDIDAEERRDAQIIVTRRDASQRLAVARKKMEADGLALAKQMANQRVKIEALRREHADEMKKELAILGDMTAAMAALEHSQTREEGALLRTKPKVLDEFLRSLIGEIDVTRKSVKWDTNTEVIDRGSHYDRKTTTLSNQTAVNARLAAIRQARELAEELTYVALDEDELAKRLAMIRGGIPAMKTLDTMVITSPTR